MKYFSSIYVFVTNPAQNEGALHIARQRIISNKSLLNNASRAGLPSYIQAKPFTFKMWQPPNFEVPAAPHINDAENAESPVGQGADSQDSRSARTTFKDESGQDISAADSGTQPPDSIQDYKVLGTHLSRKRLKKKRQQDEQNSQWLGDKVLCMFPRHVSNAKL